jgi:hypothetical protein
MATNLLLVAGGFCWSIAGVVALAHLLDGDLLVPAAMSAAGIAWVGIRYRMASTRRATVSVEADAAA